MRLAVGCAEQKQYFSNSLGRSFRKNMFPAQHSLHLVSLSTEKNIFTLPRGLLGQIVQACINEKCVFASLLSGDAHLGIIYDIYAFVCEKLW